ncbi:hypothetical protein MKK75_31640 [Methylobacterium sp. J-030]|uniref:hypothetical protein n=1 Tax=Methylobacterium sp. J-030 TaxID=2836627 RepID=UPI001FBC0489|nr:hypothetical protein [Methylobacterium sp. J-030]MCJ2073288.1 hypothetical protein [Methylobacterium sp. J-030]
MARSMRLPPQAMAASLILLVLLPAAAAARPYRHPPDRATDTDRTLTRMAARDRFRDWRAWQEVRPPARIFAPATRERVAAPPFTGWGYGGTIPGAQAGF